MVRDCGHSQHPRDVPCDLLIKKYSDLIFKAAKKAGFVRGVSINGMEMEDAIQVGRIALWQAAQSFNPDLMGEKLTHPFVVYAYTKIWQEIGNEKNRCQWMKGDKVNRVQIEHYGLEFWSFASDIDVEKEVSGIRDCERVSRAISKMRANHRNLFQAVMINDDGRTRNSSGGVYARMLGINPSGISDIRVRVRKKLRKELN